MSDPLVVEFPLRGEWTAPNTPGKRVPSHGTDALGQRYAYDFVQTDSSARGMRFYTSSPARYLFLGARLRDCPGWGRTVHSPVNGTVVLAEDGWPERDPAHPMRDLAAVLKNSLSFDPGRATDLRPLTGNYLVIRAKDAYAFLAHAQTGSIAVSPGDRVVAGQPLARVGHSGNSTAPHLHFHLMDGEDLRKAGGIPCCFRKYEVLRGGSWMTVRNGIPTHTERIRMCDAQPAD